MKVKISICALLISSSFSVYATPDEEIVLITHEQTPSTRICTALSHSSPRTRYTLCLTAVFLSTLLFVWLGPWALGSFDQENYNQTLPYGH